MAQVDTHQLEDICDNFIMSHPDLPKDWKKRMQYVHHCESWVWRGERELTPWESHLSAYIQYTPHIPNVSEKKKKELSPVIKSLPYINLSRGNWSMHQGRCWRELFKKTKESMVQEDTSQLEDICDNFIASHPDLPKDWKEKRMRWVSATVRAECEGENRDMTWWQYHLFCLHTIHTTYA